MNEPVTVAVKMKYLLAFALVAAAAALPEPVRLLEPVRIAQPDIAPLMVPQDVLDQVATQVKFVDAPEAAVDAVKIVDAPAELDAINHAVNFVDVVPEVVEAPVEADSAVKFVDVADVDEETPSYIPNDAPFQVKIIDMPLPESVVMPLDGLVVPEAVRIEEAVVDSNADFAVKFVDEAQETPVYMAMRPKEYPNPMWR